MRIDRRTNVLDPEAGEYLTSDKKNILVSNFLVWSVADPLRYLVSLTDKTSAEARLTDIRRSEVGTALGAHPLSALVSTEAQEQTMADVMRDITGKTARRASDSFGVHVAAVRIKRLNFPPQNKQAVFRRMEAERQRIARLYRSEGEEEAEKIRAQADREEAVLLNEARRQAEEIRGEADAEATRIYAEAFGQDRSSSSSCAPWRRTRTSSARAPPSSCPATPSCSRCCRRRAAPAAARRSRWGTSSTT